MTHEMDESLNEEENLGCLQMPLFAAKPVSRPSLVAKKNAPNSDYKNAPVG